MLQIMLRDGATVLTRNTARPSPSPDPQMARACLSQFPILAENLGTAGAGIFFGGHTAGGQKFASFDYLFFDTQQWSPFYHMESDRSRSQIMQSHLSYNIIF